MWPAPRKQAVQGSLFYVLNTYRVRPGQRPKIFCIISQTSQKQLKNESKQQGETFPLDTCSNHFIAHDCNRNYSLNWIEIEKLSSLYLNAVRNKFVFFWFVYVFFLNNITDRPRRNLHTSWNEICNCTERTPFNYLSFQNHLICFRDLSEIKIKWSFKVDFLVKLKTINWASSEAFSEKSRKDIHFMSQSVEPKSRRAARSRVIERISVLLLWNIKFAFNFTQFKEVYRCL